MNASRDEGLDTLLDLDGQVLVVDPAGGHWVRFVVTRVPVTSDNHTVSITRSHFMDRMANVWSDLIMPIRSANNAGASRRIIAIG